MVEIHIAGTTPLLVLVTVLLVLAKAPVKLTRQEFVDES